MKKIYKTPITEQVQVRLVGSILDPNQYGQWSNGGDEYDAKEQGDFFDMEDDDNSFGDIWGSEDEDPNDLWN